MADLQTKHAEYTKYADDWKVFNDAYHLKGGFANGEYLVPHPLEVENGTESDSFKRRKKISVAENYCAPTIDGKFDALFKRPITRDAGGDTNLEAWLNDVDRNGTSFGDWFKARQKAAQIFGHLFIFMDRPKSDALQAKAQATGTVTRADEQSAGVVPYLYARTPLDVIDWCLDAAGAFEWVKVQEKALVYGTLPLGETDPLLLPTEKTFVRVWTRTSMMLFDANNPSAPIEQVDHNLGMVPVVVLYCHRGAEGELSGRSEVNDAAPLQKDLYNLLSEVRAWQRDQAFSILTFPLMDGDDVVDTTASSGTATASEALARGTAGAQPSGRKRIAVGASRALTYNGGAHQGPAFIGADPGHAASYETRIEKTREALRAVTHTQFKAGVYSSGVAMSFDWEGVNQSISGMANECAEAEAKIIGLWYVWQAGSAANVDPAKIQYHAKYPETFTFADEGAVIQELRDAQQAAWTKTAWQEFMKAAMRRLLPTIPGDTMKAIDDEIAAMEPPNAMPDPSTNTDPTLVMDLAAERARRAADAKAAADAGAAGAGG